MVPWKHGSANIAYILYFCLTLWRHLVDFGCRFGAHWILKGVPKSIISEKTKRNRKRRENKGLRNAFETYDLLIDFWSQAGGPDMEQKLYWALNLLQVRKVGRSGKMIENTIPKVIKLDLKIEALPVQGLIFEFLDGFGKCWFFDEFSVGPKSIKNLKFAIRWAARGARAQGSAAGAGVRRALEN